MWPQHKNSCESLRIKVQVKVYDTPILPQLDSIIIICNHQTASYKCNALNRELVWYNDSTSSIPVFKGNTFTTAGLENDTVFYYGIENGPCQNSERKAIIIHINKVDVPQTDPVNSICVGKRCYNFM